MITRAALLNRTASHGGKGDMITRAAIVEAAETGDGIFNWG